MNVCFNQIDQSADICYQTKQLGDFLCGRLKNAMKNKTLAHNFGLIAAIDNQTTHHYPNDTNDIFVQRSELFNQEHKVVLLYFVTVDQTRTITYAPK